MLLQFIISIVLVIGRDFPTGAFLLKTNWIAVLKLFVTKPILNALTQGHPSESVYKLTFKTGTLKKQMLPSQAGFFLLFYFWLYFKQSI